MKPENGRITPAQFVFLIIGFIQGSFFLLSFVTNLTKRDTWISLIIGTSFFIPFAVVYFTLAKKFPGKNIIQINDLVFGKVLGKVISLYYVIYFVIIYSLNVLDLGGFYTTFIIPDQPLEVFTIPFVAVLSYVIWKGIENLGRIAHIFVFIALFVIIDTTLMLVGEMHITHFLPLFDVDIREFIKGTHIITSIPFAELIVFLMLTPALTDTKKIVKKALLGILIGFISFMIVIIRNTAVLDNLSIIVTSPSFEAMRLIKIGDLFTRMDLLMAVANTLMVFLKSAVFFYASVLSISQILGLKDYKTIILPVASITIVLASTVYESTIENRIITQNAEVLASLPIQFIIPPVTLMLAKLRKLPKPEGVLK